MNKHYLFLLVVLVGITIMTMAKGGAFEPDNVVGVDTVFITVSVPLRIDTVYLQAKKGCGILVLPTGSVEVSYVKRDGYRWGRVASYSRIQIQKVTGYRTCDGEQVVMLPNRVTASLWN